MTPTDETARPCQDCPFRKDCPACPFQGAKVEDVSDPRERRNSGGLAGTDAGGADMATIPHTTHILDPIGDLFPRVPHLDYAKRVESCPECMARHVTPATVETVPNGAQCHYACHVCGCQWTTSWWEGEG